ncbi:MAG: alpha/beta hydrolase [Phycisphaerae bacterium]
MLLIWIGAIALLVGGLLLALYLGQGKLVYHPRREHEATPEEFGLSVEDAWLTTDDGVKVHGWFAATENARGAVLMCHGNGGNISHRLDMIDLWQRQGLSVLVFDYRGYGRSGGSPTEEGTYADARAAWAYLTEQKQIPPQRIILHGRSLGGAIAAYLASRYDAGGLIVDSAFTSLPDVGADIYPYLPVRMLVKYRYATREYLAEANCPVLIIHSRDDDIVPFEHGEALFKAAGEPKTFVEVNGSHNDQYLMDAGKYNRALREMVDRVFGDQPQTAQPLSP